MEEYRENFKGNVGLVEKKLLMRELGRGDYTE